MTPDPIVRWFYVAADYKSIHFGKQQQRYLWERRVFVYRATQEQAEAKALAIAQQNEVEYVSATGDTVIWKLQAIESFAELFDDNINDGTEVYWDWFHSISSKRRTRSSLPVRRKRYRHRKQTSTSQK
jgi:hypothetical protein